MSKFKKGDWVRVLHTDFEEEFPIGSVVQVHEVDGVVYLMHTEGKLCFYDSELEAWQPKVGERVQIVDPSPFRIGTKVGDTAEVTGFDRSWINIILDHSDDGKIDQIAQIRQIRPAAPVVEASDTRACAGGGFKAGDRIRLVRDPVHGSCEIGDEFIAVARTNGASGSVHFKRADGTVTWRPGSYFELVKPLKIEAGRYYKTRDGRKVGPLEKDAVGYLCASVPGDRWRSFKIDGGKHCSGRSELDLIAEWPAAPAKPVVAATVDYLADEYGSGVVAMKRKIGDKLRITHIADDRDKTLTKHIGKTITVDSLEGTDGTKVAGKELPYWFWARETELITNDNASVAQQPVAWIPKVGDRVRCLSGSTHYQGVTGTIAEDDGTWNVRYRVFLDRPVPHWGDKHLWRTGKGDMELLSHTRPTAIVAIIEDGKPKPNSRPFVHATVDSARVEAERLANVHRGKQFGVYVLTGEPVVNDKPSHAHEWQRQAANGNKFAAIRELRGITGMGLKPAKDAVDYFVANAA